MYDDFGMFKCRVHLSFRQLIKSSVLWHFFRLFVSFVLPAFKLNFFNCPGITVLQPVEVENNHSDEPVANLSSVTTNNQFPKVTCAPRYSSGKYSCWANSYNWSGSLYTRNTIVTAILTFCMPVSIPIVIQSLAVKFCFTLHVFEMTHATVADKIIPSVQPSNGNRKANITWAKGIVASIWAIGTHL